jgi:hypothetical protein
MKRILKSPPVVGLATGAGVGIISVLMFLFLGADGGDYHFAFSIHNDLMEIVLDAFVGLVSRIDGDCIVCFVLLLWYGQYGFYGGIVYWLLRKKLKRPFAILLLTFFFIMLFALIYWLNGYFGRWF